ncbi:thiol-dependent ubiquitin-specific protease [Aureococcus anophagefferens]|nr:thiol-dependent ubiquitin-specific protease [Aureococcus anophagefferens]
MRLRRYADASETLLKGIACAPSDANVRRQFDGCLHALREQGVAYHNMPHAPVGTIGPAQLHDPGATPNVLASSEGGKGALGIRALGAKLKTAPGSASHLREGDSDSGDDKPKAPPAAAADEKNTGDALTDADVHVALNNAGAFLHLEDLIEPEIEFWKSNGLELAFEEVLEGVHQVLLDFKPVLRSIFLNGCHRYAAEDAKRHWEAEQAAAGHANAPTPPSEDASVASANRPGQQKGDSTSLQPRVHVRSQLLRLLREVRLTDHGINDDVALVAIGRTLGRAAAREMGEVPGTRFFPNRDIHGAPRDEPEKGTGGEPPKKGFRRMSAVSAHLEVSTTTETFPFSTETPGKLSVKARGMLAQRPAAAWADIMAPGQGLNAIRFPTVQGRRPKKAPKRRMSVVADDDEDFERSGSGDDESSRRPPSSRGGGGASDDSDSSASSGSDASSVGSVASVSSRVSSRSGRGPAPQSRPGSATAKRKGSFMGGGGPRAGGAKGTFRGRQSSFSAAKGAPRRSGP